jgi:hypothetical protein
MGASTFCADNVLYPILVAVEAVFPLGFPVNNDAMLELLSMRFSNHSCGILDGCVLTIDGFCASTHCPFKTQVIQSKANQF